MKIATWNVNSIRTRLNHIVQWLQENPVDALCLQEIKVVNESFPSQAFTDLGYFAAVSGQKSYNGVAILSRQPLTDVSTGFSSLLGENFVDLDEQRRVIAGTLDGVRILNLYVPNGSAVGSDKYAYKLRWLAALRDYLKTLLSNQSGKLLMCGDFNIALADIDIHDPTGREKEVMATELERDALRAVLEVGMADVFRKFTPDGGHFSWWDYRQGSFRRNRGWRIDHIYLTPDLYEGAIACTIDKAPRALEQPSDHVPVIVEL